MAGPNGKFPIRDQRHVRWFWIDNELVDIYLPKIGPSAFTVYCGLVRMSKLGVLTSEQSDIAKKLGITDRTLRRALEKLTDPEVGLVGIDRQGSKGGAATYVILEFPKVESEWTKMSGHSGQKCPVAPDKNVRSLLISKQDYKNNTVPSSPAGEQNEGRGEEIAKLWKENLDDLVVKLSLCAKAGMKPPPEWDMLFNAAPAEIRHEANKLLMEAYEAWKQTKGDKPQ